MIGIQSGPFGDIAFRFHHSHWRSNTGNPFLKVSSSYGLVDHNLIEDIGTTGMKPPLYWFGDGTTNGYNNWNAANQLGTNQALYFEANEYLAQNGTTTTEGLFEGYAGAREVIRFNTISNTRLSGGHGLDSGPYRSAMLMDIYGNKFINNTGALVNPFSSRGGMTLMHQNSFTGANGYQQMQLQYFRVSQSSPIFTDKGLGHANVNWMPVSTDHTVGLQSTLNAPDWQATHSYAANATIGPNPGGGGFNYLNTAGACTSGGTRPTFNTTVGSTTTGDGSPACSWLNVAGVLTASAATTGGWCAANPDTLPNPSPYTIANANAVCAALSGGDTISRFTDTNGGVYTFRDQDCVGHNQVSAPCYEWLDTGFSGQVMIAQSGLSGVVNECRDFFTYSPTFNGTCATGSGVGSGTFASLPVTCSVGTAFWVTDRGSWNTSGNGFGQGVLYQCGAGNVWSVYYTPLTYPYPGSGVSQVATPTFSPSTGSYFSPQTVTVTSATGGATICYTNDGTTPTANGAGTCTHGTTLANGGTVSVIFTQLLQAIGTESGFTDSAVGSAQYTFTNAALPTMVAGSIIPIGSTK